MTIVTSDIVRKTTRTNPTQAVTKPAEKDDMGATFASRATILGLGLAIASVIPNHLIAGTGQSLLTVLVCASLVIGPRRAKSRCPRGWLLLAITFGIVQAFPVAEYATKSLPEKTASGVMSALGLISVTTLLLGLGSLMRARRPGFKLAVVLDTMILFISASAVLEGLASKAGGSPANLGEIVQISLFAFTARLAVSRRSGTSFRLLLGFMAACAAGTIVDTFAEPLIGEAHIRISRWIWFSGLALIAGAGLHPTVRELSERSTSTKTRPVGLTRLGLIGLALLAGPLIVLLDNPNSTAAITGAALSSVLISMTVTRFGLIVRERDRAQLAVQASEARFRSLAHRQEALASFGKFGLQSNDISQLLTRAAMAIHEVLEVDAVAAFEMQPSETLDLRAFVSDNDEKSVHPDAHKTPLEEQSLEMQSLRARRTMSSDDLARDGSAKIGLAGQYDFRSALTCLIEGDGRPFGLLAVYSTEATTLDIDVVEFITSMTGMIAMAISRAESERELRQAQKLEAVGRLSAGLAHEINTPMQFVGDNIRFLRDSCESLIQHIRNGQDADLDFLEEEIPDATKQAVNGVQRVIDIVKAMKAFGQPDETGSQVCDINEAIRNTLTVACNEVNAVADVKLQLDNNRPIICRVSEVNQSILHLVTNAVHAIAEQNATTGRTRGLINISTQNSEEGVTVTVADNGHGIPTEIQGHVFDPFFTTKEIGRGAGQGLSVVRSVAASHNGKVTFESSETGTSFHLYLPFDPSPQHLKKAVATK